MIQEYMMVAIGAALKAGKEILSVYNDLEADFEIERKADNSPLTVADRKGHEAIVNELNRTPFPVLSEEGVHADYRVRSEWDTLWVVDPLDGTKEFIKRNGEFTVNIALVQAGVSVGGVVYVPVQQALYFAAQDFGAYKCIGITSLCSEDGDPKKGSSLSWKELVNRSQLLPVAEVHRYPIVVASRSHRSLETEAYIADLEKKHGGVELVTSGSSIKICLVAEGKADVYPRFAPTMEWDTAAGHAIARAAGMEIYQAGTDESLHYNKEDLLNPWFIVERRR